MTRMLLACALACFSVTTYSAEPSKPLKVLFLGDNGHHRPADRFAQLKPALGERGIEVVYTGDMNDVTAEDLAKYDCLLVYANTLAIAPEQEKAMLDFIASGKGFVPVHCASACFINSPKYIELVGAQFKRHGTGDFTTTTAAPDHPVMKGFEPFTTWDETYVHARHNENRTVLQVRKDKEGAEPWTWVRTHGKGRVFYTAYGHDQRTWSNPGFQELMERGIRWTCGDERAVAPRPRTVVGPASVPAGGDAGPAMTAKRTDVKPFEYKEAKIAYYSAKPGAGPRGADAGWNKMQLPVEPAESAKHVVTPENFEAKLFAADPDIVKPISMNWDHKGRLWILESVDYPNNKQRDGGGDRIKICEDTDGDGRADKFTIFADKLSIPTSLTFANGGVIVHQAPETLYLKDTNGDDKADERKVLFTGWGVGDTHAGPSNLKQGFDGWVWGIVGYSGFNGSIGGEKFKFGQGFYRFKPDGSKFEFLRSTNNNSWGVGFSEDGLLFGSTANGNPSMYLPLPNRYYEAVRGWSGGVLGTIAEALDFYPVTEKVRQVDWHGKFTAAAGHALYTARAYPKEYWNRTAFVNEPTGHLTATFVIDRKGSDFTSRNSWNLFASDDEWTAPIMAEVGPDGMVWVIDWYNYIVQHNPTPAGFKNGKGNAYDTDIRDKVHGRVYRVVHKNGKPTAAPKLDPAQPETLLAGLASDNLLWRMHAQRLLVERANKDVVPALVKLTQDPAVDAIGNNPAALHALWTLHGLGGSENNKGAADADVAALKHPSAAVRRAAALVLPRNEASTAAILAANLLADPDAHVRMATFLALAEMPRSDAAATAIAAVYDRAANTNDRWIPDALTCAAAAHDVAFLKAVAAAPQAEQYLEAKPVAIVTRVAEHFARGGPADSIGAVLASLPGGHGTIQSAIVTGLAAGWPKDRKAALDETAEKALVKLLTELPSAAKGQLVTLAAKMGTDALTKYAAEIGAMLLAKVKDEKEADAARGAAATQLIDFRKNDAATVTELLSLISPRTSPELSTALLEALRRSESAQLGELLTDRLATFTPSLKQQALSVLLGRGEWTEAFVKALESGKAQLSDLSLDQKQALAAHPTRAVAEAAKKLLARGGGLPDADRQKVIDELTPLVLKKADAAKGKAVFTQNCAKCHQHSGEGNRIGPDLTGMAAHPKNELLIHIIDPSRGVEGNFRQYLVATKDGRVLTGLLSSETKTAIELQDAEAKTHTILREDIKKLAATPKSLMPEGFEKQVNAESIADLLEFLTQRGKFMPLDLSKVATSNTTQGMFYSKETDVERLVFPDWKPKTFEGVPFNLVDPQGDKFPNAVMLYGPTGNFPPKMPKSVALPCNAPAKAIHLLSGVSGWGATRPNPNGSVSMIVRLKYADGTTEDHALRNGVHFADYIRVVEVPESKLAFKLREQQIRYLAVRPKRGETIAQIEFVKGPDNTAPVIMAATVETAGE